MAQIRVQVGNPPGEDYLTRVARLNALRKKAEEIVLAELILLPPESGPDAARMLTSTRHVPVGRVHYGGFFQGWLPRHYGRQQGPLVRDIT